MTKECILSLNHKGLNYEIATKIMNWDIGNLSGEQYWFKNSIWYAIILTKEWIPSEDIWCAWQVIEKLREEGKLANIIVDSDRYRVQIHEMCTEKLLADVINIKDAPEAICKAALIAKLELQ